MDENQNFEYNDGTYNGQDATPVQQPYNNQQYGGQPYDNQQHGQPYDNQQAGPQYGQPPYYQQAGPQYSQTPYGVQQYNQQNFGQPVVYDTVPNRASGTSVAALVCGILGLVFFWVLGVDLVLCLVGLICAIISLVRGSGSKGMAITGLVLSIIASILTLIILYVFTLLLLL